MVGNGRPWGHKSQTWLSDFTFTFHFHALEKEMATHSSVLAWRIPGTGEPGGLPSMGSHRVGHDWSDLAAAAELRCCPLIDDFGFPGGSDGKESACNARDAGSFPGSGRSPGEGNGYPLQYLAWRIPWTEEPGGLQFMGSQRVGHNWVTRSLFHFWPSCGNFEPQFPHL